MPPSAGMTPGSTPVAVAGTNAASAVSVVEAPDRAESPGVEPRLESVAHEEVGGACPEGGGADVVGANHEVVHAVPIEVAP